MKRNFSVAWGEGSVCISCGHHDKPRKVKRYLDLLECYCDNCYLLITGWRSEVPVARKPMDMDDISEFFDDCREDAVRSLEDTDWMEWTP